MSPRVLHLSTYAYGGGAARAANGVHQALHRIGADSKNQTAAGNRFRFARAADRTLWRFQRSSLKTWRSPARFGSLSSRSINNSAAEIVNLHWVTDGFLSIESIGGITKPVVLSMYDMWPFCGAEHYGLEGPEARWRVGYFASNRPTGDSGIDIDRYAWERKRRMWQNFNIVAASSWLEQAAKQSALMSDWNITKIPHPVDESAFQMSDKLEARSVLGLPPKRTLIGFVASGGVSDSRKGFDLLCESLPRISKGSPPPELVLVGPTPEAGTVPHTVSFHGLGQVSDDSVLSMVYNAIDVLAVPSRQDNLPLTAMEAQMSGCPVVGYNIGGLTDIVQHLQTGYLAKPFDPVDFARGLELFTNQTSSRNHWGQASRARAIEDWSYEAIGSRYLSFYRSLLP